MGIVQLAEKKKEKEPSPLTMVNKTAWNFAVNHWRHSVYWSWWVNHLLRVSQFAHCRTTLLVSFLATAHLATLPLPCVVHSLVSLPPACSSRQWVPAIEQDEKGQGKTHIASFATRTHRDTEWKQARQTNSSNRIFPGVHHSLKQIISHNEQQSSCTGNLW